MSEFVQTFAAILRKIEEAGLDYMVVGSVASMAYGQARLTNDIDIVIEIPVAMARHLPKIFPAPEYYLPPEEILSQEVINRGQFNLLHIPSGLKADFVVRKHSPHGTAEFQRRKRLEFIKDLAIWIAAPEDVILKKLVYFQEGRSPKHVDDIRAILAGVDVDTSYINHWVHRLDLVATWQQVSNGVIPMSD